MKSHTIAENSLDALGRVAFRFCCNFNPGKFRLAKPSFPVGPSQFRGMIDGSNGCVREPR